MQGQCDLFLMSLRKEQVNTPSLAYGIYFNAVLLRS